jgi:hypothetical protein
VGIRNHALDTLCPRDGEFARVSSHEYNASRSEIQGQRHEQSELSVSEDEDGIGPLYLNLLFDLKRGSQRFHKGRRFIANAVWNAVQVLERQRDVLRKTSIPAGNPEHGSIRAMGGKTASTIITTITNAVDLADNSARHPIFGTIVDLLDGADKLVSQDAGETHVPLGYLQVRITDTGHTHTDQRFSLRGDRPGIVRLNLNGVVKGYRFHIVGPFITLEVMF